MTAWHDEYSTAAWRKSRASMSGGECVEVAPWHSFVLVRDSRNRSGGLLKVTGDQWREFLEFIRPELRSACARGRVPVDSLEHRQHMLTMFQGDDPGLGRVMRLARIEPQRIEPGRIR